VLFRPFAFLLEVKKRPQSSSVQSNAKFCFF